MANNHENEEGFTDEQLREIFHALLERGMQSLSVQPFPFDRHRERVTQELKADGDSDSLSPKV